MATTIKKKPAVKKIVKPKPKAKPIDNSKAFDDDDLGDKIYILKPEKFNVNKFIRK